MSSRRRSASIFLGFALLTFPIARADDATSAWESAIARFEEQDRASRPREGGIVFVGSSSIRLWNLAESFPDLPVLNRGFGGSQASDSAHFAERIVIRYRPRLVVFYAGDNDLAFGKSPERIRDDFKSFASKVTTALPETSILYLTVKPSVARWKLIDKQRQTNDLVAALIQADPRVQSIDMATPLLGKDGQPRPELFLADGLHLNAAGYRVWSETLRPHLK